MFLIFFAYSYLLDMSIMSERILFEWINETIDV